MQQRIDAIIALTDEVQAAIDAGDWVSAAALEARRLEALKALVAATAPSGGGDIVTEFLAATRQRGLELIGEVDHHKRRLERDASMIRTGHRAAGRYEETAQSRP